jgi:hypothetical protein
MKQKKLIDEEEKVEVELPAKDPQGEENYYLEDSTRDYRSLKASIDL